MHWSRWEEEGCSLHTKCSRHIGKHRVLGQGCGKVPPKLGRELSVGHETGLAPVVPALMSWKREEMSQHEKVRHGRPSSCQLNRRGRSRMKRGPIPSPHPGFSSWRLDLPGEGTWAVRTDELRLKRDLLRGKGLERCQSTMAMDYRGALPTLGREKVPGGLSVVATGPEERM